MISKGTEADVSAAVGAAVTALEAPFPAYARYEVLMAAAALIDRDREAYARVIASEGSKAIREARREPPRAATILRNNFV